MPSRRTLRTRTTTATAATYNATHGQRHNTAVAATEGDALYLSRSDIQYSIDAFRAVLRTATVYREQLEKTSQDASNFALALEQLARTDLGDEGVGAGLQACAGFHNLISNQNQVLGDTLYKTFERPLKEHCSDYEAKLKSDEMEYEQTVAVLGESIRRTEARSFDLGRRGERDLNTFRSAIADLTRQVDDLESVKAAYYQGVRDTRTLSLGLVLQTVSAVVRAEVDVYEKIAHKGITDSILEGMIASVPDPFESYSTSSSSEIFSILPPLHSDGYPTYPATEQSYDAQQNIYPISEEITGETQHRDSGFDSNGTDSFKHDSGTVNAFAALFGATITEVLAGQDDDDDEDDDEDYRGNEDCNDDEDEKCDEEEEDDKGDEVEEDDKGDEEDEEVEGDGEVEEVEGDKEDGDYKDDEDDEDGEGGKANDADEDDEDGKGDVDYEGDEGDKVDDDDEEVEGRDRNAGDGNGRRNSSDALDDASVTSST